MNIASIVDLNRYYIRHMKNTPFVLLPNGMAKLDSTRQKSCVSSGCIFSSTAEIKVHKTIKMLSPV